jgi:hypothetical protein
MRALTAPARLEMLPPEALQGNASAYCKSATTPHRTADLYSSVYSVDFPFILLQKLVLVDLEGERKVHGVFFV